MRGEDWVCIELKWNWSICAWILRCICGRPVILRWDFFASRIGRSKMECSAFGFSYVRWKPRNGQLAKMDSFHQRKRSDHKWYAVEVRWGIFIENLIVVFHRAVVNILIQAHIIPPWLCYCARWSSHSWSFGCLWLGLTYYSAMFRPSWKSKTKA